MTEKVYFDNYHAHVCTDDLDGQRVVVLEIDCFEVGVEDARAIAAAILDAALEVERG